MIKKIIVREYESNSWELRLTSTLTTRKGIIGDKKFVEEEVRRIVLSQPIKAPYTVEWNQDGLPHGYMVGGVSFGGAGGSAIVHGKGSVAIGGRGGSSR